MWDAWYTYHLGRTRNKNAKAAEGQDIQYLYMWKAWYTDEKEPEPKRLSSRKTETDEVRSRELAAVLIAKKEDSLCCRGSW